MSIKKYTNIDDINNKTQNEGQFLQAEDLFIVSKNEIEDTDFGDCKYDVMEVSVYDINSNLLPQKSGNNVAYVKKQDIKNYMYSLVNKGGQKELAINIEKLLKDLGFTNGILKVNINFVRNKVGSDNTSQRVWIQEISPSREEIRIIPLKTSDENINNITKYEFKKINNLSKDFKYYKKNILDALDKFESNSLSVIDDALIAKFGNDFRAVVRHDFGLRDLDGFNKRIFENFRDSIRNWVNNRYYDVSQSNFGKPSETRFEDCEQYDFNMLLTEIQSILNNCISANIKTLKRRGVNYNQIPKEFGIVELRKQIQDNLESFQTRVDIKRNIYSPDLASVNVVGTSELPPIQTIIETPIRIEPPVIEQPTPPAPPAPPMNTRVKVYTYYITNGSNTTGQYGSGFTNSFGYYDADGIERIGKSLTPGESTQVCAQQGTIRSGGPNWTVTQGAECNTQPVSTPVNVVTTPIYSGGGGGGGGRIADDYRNYGGAVVDRGMEQQYT